MIIDTSNWHWQQWYFIILWAIIVLSNIIYHGKTKPISKYNAWSMIPCMMWALYVLGSAGFFK